MNETANTAGGSGRVIATVAWALAPVAWFTACFVWLYTEADRVGTTAMVGNALAIALLILPAPWLLWASWRMPRPRAKTYVAEGGALVTMLLSLIITAAYFLLSFDPAALPMGFTLAYFAAAAVFVAAAWPLPNRRIAYGAAALALVLVGTGAQVPFWEAREYPGIGFTAGDEVLSWVFIGLPAIGVLLQLAWWFRGKARAGVEA